jgi:hypothetical protein
MLNCDAVANSIAVMEKLASPSISTTIESGLATFAPMADGTPYPIGPRPPEVIMERG